MRPTWLSLLCTLVLAGSVRADAIKLSGPKLRTIVARSFATWSADMGRAPAVQLGKVRALDRVSEGSTPGVDVAYEIRIQRPGALPRTLVRTVRLDEATGQLLGKPIRYRESGIGEAMQRIPEGERLKAIRELGLSEGGAHLVIEVTTDRAVRSISVPLASENPGTR